MLGNVLMRPFFNNKSTNAFSCLLNALPSAEVNIAIIVFAAKPYANAVFEIAQQNKSHADWKGVLEVGASVANDATMRAFVASPNFNNKSTNAFSCLLNALPSAEVNIAIIVFALLALVELGDATNARIVC
jgi:hypothetical protein